MNWPNRGGATDRIRIKSNGSLANPKVGDIWSIVLGKNIVASDFTMTQTRNGTPTSLTLVGMDHTVTSADIPAIGGSWPLFANANNLTLQSTPVNVTNPPTVPATPVAPVLTALANAISVAYTVPANGGSAILEAQFLGSDGVETALTGSPQTIAKTAGVAITGRTRFRNTVGWSDYSPQSNSVTPTSASDVLPLHSLIAQEGDSITAQEAWTESALYEYGGAQYMYPYQGNQALSGTTTTQQLAPADINAVVSKNAAAITLLTGTNDIALTSNTPTQIFNNIQSLINQHCANGVCKKYLCIKILPRNDATFTGLTPQRQADLALTNALLDNLVAPNGVDLRVITITGFDPTTDTADGLHPNYAGARKIGSIAGPVLSGWINQTDLRPLYADASNLIVAAGLNAAFTGTGGTKSGGITGTVADNWTASIATDGTLACVCSTVDNGDGSFSQKFKLTGTPATSGRNTSLAKAIPITGSQIGDQYECWVVCTIEKGVGLMSMAARINSRGISLGGTYTTSQNIAPGVFLLRSKLHLAETTAVTTLTPNMTLVLGTGEVDVEVSFSKPYLRRVV